MERVVLATRRQLDVPIAAIGLADGQRAWSIVSGPGSEPGASPDQIPLPINHPMAGDRLVVADALKEDSMRDLPVVAGPPNIRLYAAVRLRLPDASAEGTLCIASPEPRVLTDEELEHLGDLARWAESELGAAQAEQTRARESEHESRHASVLETMVDGVITIDEAGVVLSFNPAATRIFGYAPEEVIGQSVSMLMPDPHRARHDAYISDYLRTGEARIIGIGREEVGLRKDGSEFPIELAVGETVLPTGRLFTGIVRDVTERREAEEQVRRLNAELEERVTERTGELAIANESLAREAAERTALAEIGRIISSSPHVGEVYGEFAAQVHGLVPFERIAICTIDASRQTFTEAYVADGRGLPQPPGAVHKLPGTAAEEVLRRRSAVLVAETSAVEVARAFPCMGPLIATASAGAAAVGAPIIASDRVIGLINVGARDPKRFTERDMAMLEQIGLQIGAPLEMARLYELEATLRDRAEDARARLEAILQASAAAVVIVDAVENRVLVATDEARRILGVDLQPGDGLERYERPVSFYQRNGSPLPPSELPLQLALTRREVVRDVEISVERADGSRLPIVVSAAPVVATDGRLTAAITVFQDISHLKELDDVKDDFLSMISHDLRGPMATIQGLASAALTLAPHDGEDSERLREYLQSAHEEVGRMTELVSNLIDMSRIEAGVLPLEPEESHMADLAGDAVRRALRSRPGAGRTVTADAPVDLPPLYVDPGQVGRVLDNLISNALKYSLGEVVVKARHRPDEGVVVTSVIDTGAGIPRDAHDRIFEKFF
ncbi:MAG: PAS domain S-box protein, partial [Dehalococcoidia bacterium]